MVNRDERGRFKKGYKPYFSEEHRKKISEAKKGKKFTDEHKKKLSNAHIGKKKSNETRKNMSIAQTGRVITWGDKISTSLKYRKLTKARRKQMSLDQGGKNKIDSAHYKAIHKWIVEQKGKPLICDFCKTTEAKLFEWSNKSQKYLFDINDWQRLCKKCHVNYDIQYKKNSHEGNHGKLTKIFTED